MKSDCQRITDLDLGPCASLFFGAASMQLNLLIFRAQSILGPFALLICAIGLLSASIK
jgi:hypothetical protein